MEECIIYGAGKYGKAAYEEFYGKLNVLFFADADEKKWNHLFCTLPVKSPVTIYDNNKTLVLIALKFGAKDVLFNLKKLGVENARIYYPGMSILEDPKLEEIKRTEPRILIDSILINENNRPTGPERFVHKIEYEISALRSDCLFIRAIGNSMVTNDICMNSSKHSCEINNNATVKKVSFFNGDKLLFIAPYISNSFYDAIDYVATQNIELYVVVYDLYSFYDIHNAPRYGKEGLVRLFYKVLGFSKGILCYSKAVIDELVMIYKKRNIQRMHPMNIYLFPLGSDIVKRGAETIARDRIRRFLDRQVVFLMVGSLRQHKGYDVVLEAFQKVNFHCDVSLLILGQHISQLEGSLKQKIIKAENEMNNILWIDDATDDEVGYCYKNSTALIAASRYEGYGLPLVEAAQHGLPIICSDIPVFREVTCGHATFFRVGDSDSLAETLKKWLEEKEHPDSRKIPIHTWRESAKAILDIVEGRTAPYVTLQ